MQTFSSSLVLFRMPTSPDTPLPGYVAIAALGVAQFVDSVTDADPRKTISASSPTAASPFACLGTMLEEYRIRIELRASSSPGVPKRIPVPFCGVVRHELNEMEREGVVRDVEAPTAWCVGLTVVPKATGCAVDCASI